jgi:hypothetical protein
MATVTIGGSKPACITQLEIMPVSSSSWRTVRIKMPLGTRPKILAIGESVMIYYA